MGSSQSSSAALYRLRPLPLDASSSSAASTVTYELQCRYQAEDAPALPLLSALPSPLPVRLVRFVSNFGNNWILGRN